MVDVPDQWEIVRWLLFLVVTQADIWLCHFQNTASKLAVFVIPLYLRSWKEKKKKKNMKEVCRRFYSLGREVR